MKRYPTDQLTFARKLRRDMTNAGATAWRSLRSSNEIVMGGGNMVLERIKSLL